MENKELSGRETQAGLTSEELKKEPADSGRETISGGKAKEAKTGSADSIRGILSGVGRKAAKNESTDSGEDRSAYRFDTEEGQVVRRFGTLPGLQKDESFLESRLFRYLLVAVAAVLVIALVIGLWRVASGPSGGKNGAGKEAAGASSAVEAVTEAATEAQTEPAAAVFSPHCTEKTKPENLISYTEVEVDGVYLQDLASYQPWYHIDFGTGDTYTEAEGIITFRGDPFRDHAAWGNANLKEHVIESVWQADTGGLSYGSASWSGSGWTGQPLLMKWPAQVKAATNMYDQAKAKDDLVEVIYACMDGFVYFLDLETGEATRDALYLGYTFKGAGALDPRGYPILYVGSGYDSNQGTSRAFIINLLDCSVMYEFGNDDSFSLRGHLSFFDASPLVDADSDTLIWPGENGILYLIHLGTAYDTQAGTLSIEPDHVVKWHYNGNRSSAQSYWLGMEDSPAIFGEYMFIADNGGNLMCLNLNTLELVWAQDTLDDSNSTPVLAMEDGHLYLYVSTSFHLGWRSNTTALVPVWKIDAETGEIVWHTDYECYTEDGVSGGVQSTVAPGSGVLENYLYVTVARVGEPYSGILACLDRTTGHTVWEHKAYYAWSSPVCVYSEDGTGLVLYCDCSGKMYLLNGVNGDVLHTIELSEGAIEASPAVYDSRIVVGTRACKIWGLELK